MGWFKRLKKDEQSETITEDVEEIIETQESETPQVEEPQNEILDNKKDELNTVENEIIEKYANLKSISDKLESVKEEYDNAVSELMSTKKELNAKKKENESLTKQQNQIISILCAIERKHNVLFEKQKGFKITKIFDTHQHADHVSSVRDLAKATGAKLYLSKYEGYDFDANFIGDQDKISFGKTNLKVVHTPGHTPGTIL